MKINIAIIFTLVSVFAGKLHAQEGHDQTVLVNNLRKIKGKLYIGWYINATDFRKADKSVIKTIVDINGDETVPVVFGNVPPGIYAIAVFLDENNNGKIDTNILGIPKEKYGFSNNVHPLTRAASFKESAFTVEDKRGNIVIRLK